MLPSKTLYLLVLACVLQAPLSGCRKDSEDATPRLNPATLGASVSAPVHYADKYKLEIVSGNEQVGVPGAPLPEPLVVRVTDHSGAPVEHAMVSLLTSVVSVKHTDANGIARLYWTPPPVTDYPASPTVQVALNNQYGTIELEGSPCTFTAIYKAEVVAEGTAPYDAPNSLNRPSGVFADAAGNVYIADSYNHRIVKWAPGATSGQVVAGGNGEGYNANQLYHPSDIFVDPAGNMYITNSGTKQVIKWAPGAASGEVVASTGYWGSALGGIFVDAAQNIYVTDADQNVVMKFAPGNSWGYSIVAGSQVLTPNSVGLNGPTDVFVTPSGDMYITCGQGFSVVKWTPGATDGVVVAGGNGSGYQPNQLAYPLAIWLDAAGDMYIADYDKHTLKWTPGAATGQIVAAGGTDVFVDPNGVMYVVERDQHRVLKWFP